ncbi:MAG: hypothetical protein GVY36_10040 [Verrucomicrobia bacterium]|jgi:hypothetical protein|nr:hypothetical protein [Verrucomicrobiota bacterium]
MTSPSEEFKQKLLAPIEDLLRDALDGDLPPAAMGGRNWQMPGAGLFGPGLFGPQAKRPKAVKQKPGVVDEAAFREPPDG